MLTAIYDGQCVICNTTRRLVRALDWFKRVEFLDLHQQDEVTRRYPFIDHAEAFGSIQVIDRSQRIYAGFHGVRRMLRTLPLGWPLYLLLRLPVIGNWLGPRVYRFIAANRYAINRLFGVRLEEQAVQEGACEDTCRLP